MVLLSPCRHIFLIVGEFFFLLHNNYCALCIYERKYIFKWVLNVVVAWWTLETSAFIVLLQTLFFLLIIVLILPN